MFNLLPNLNVAELIKAFAGKFGILHTEFALYFWDIYFYGTPPPESKGKNEYWLMLFLSFAVKTNDMMLVIYLSSLIRSVIALHNLINNKVRCHFLCVIACLISIVVLDHVGTLNTSLELVAWTFKGPSLQVVLEVIIHSLILCFLMSLTGVSLAFLQMLNKEHEKAEDSKPVAVPTAAGS